MLYVDIAINGIRQPDIYPIRYQEPLLWLAKDQAHLLNLRDNIGLKEAVFFEQKFILLPAWITATLDRAELLLSLTIPPEHMNVSVIRDQKNHIAVSEPTTAAYWNMDLIAYQTGEKFPYLLSGNRFIVALPFGIINNQISGSLESTHRLIRLETSYEYDFINHNIRLVAGDFATDAPNFFNPVALGGVKLTKGSLFQSGSLGFPTIEFHGFVPKPAEAQIWINDHLRIKKDIPMGGFLLDNLALPTGSQQGKLVIKDSTGIISSIPFSYYSDSEMLRAGESSYSYSLGFLRKDYGNKSFSYGMPALFASHKIGINNFWTPAYHLQLCPQTAVIALEQRLRLFSFGSTGIATALSYNQEDWGFLGSLQLQIEAFYTNFRTRVLAHTKDYASVSATKKAESYPALTLVNTLKIDLPYVKYSYINHVLSVNKEIYHNIGVRQQIPITNQFNLNMGIDYRIYHDNFYMFALLSYRFFDNHRASVQLQNDDGLNVQATYFVDPVTNKDYRLSYGAVTQVGHNLNGQGMLSFENQYIHSRFDITGNKDILNYAAGVSTALTFIKGRLFWSKPIERGVTLIELPGQENITIYQDTGRRVGKTDKNGFLLITDLAPYQKANFTIDVKDLSLFVTPSNAQEELSLTPGYRTAHALSLATQSVRHLYFRLVNPKNPIASGTRIVMEQFESQSFVMHDGSIYMEVPDHLKKISGRDEFNDCHFSIDLSASPHALIEELHDVYCF